MASKTITILAIETSCDETAAAVLDCSGGFDKPAFKIRSNIVASQAELHAEWGGVVPNLAKREHKKNLPGVLERALRKAGIGNPAREIGALAVTVGPGLEPALWTGITFAQKLSQDWNLPIVAANHMEGHIAAALLGHKKRQTIIFPALALLVSGGHTELVLIKNWLKYKVMGETQDDAAGEAFDKVARMLGLGYPGGPILGQLAKTGNRYAFSFPRPMINAKNFDFSFSGLKTAVLYTLRDLKENKTSFTKNDVAASFEDAVVDVLILKTLRASREARAKTIVIGGGVAANALLRRRLAKAVALENTAPKFIVPRIALTSDNATMIAASTYFHALKKDFTDWKKLEARATMPL